MVQAALMSDLTRFCRGLSATVPVTRAILFGSRARGDARPDRDVDLLLVSPAFAGKSVVERALPVRRAWNLDYAVDFLCYSPEEFEHLKGRARIVQLAIAEGVPIAT